MPNVITRIASIEDLPAVAALFDAYRQFYRQAADPDLATRFIGDRMRNRESLVIVAEDERHQVTGFCQLYPTFCSVEARPIYSLYDLFVAPASRNSGAGRALLLAAEEQARIEGVARMDLTTARTNQVAQSLYESLGWVRDEVFFGYSKRIAA